MRKFRNEGKETELTNVQLVLRCWESSNFPIVGEVLKRFCQYLQKFAQ